MSKNQALELLREEARSLSADLEAVNRAIAVLEGKGAGTAAPAGRRRGRKPGPKPKAAAEAPARRRRPTMTAEQRNAVSLRMKRYWAARREAKAKEQGD
ncbi:MAG: hypothetical protein F4Y45_15585 [Acidobacteria bacterium]|nr:hypothetical protein [Acidobacteriota bacterium]MYD70644.1 hypothetical protein [Acidobacteriota bacterium]MYJ03266.1 hypothetical protein [Acidobacteriota bacterium]